jgi:FtsZ-interacting cell division protein ZipA
MEIRTALILAGSVVLLAVILISFVKYQAVQRREREARTRRFDESGHEPVLVHQSELGYYREHATTEEHDKPVLSPDTLVINESEQEDIDSESQLTDELIDAEQVASLPIEGPVDFPLEGERGEGPQVDFVAYIPGKKVIKRDTALSVYRQNEYLLEKPHRIYGLSHPAHIWCNLEDEADGGRYTDLVLTIQLTDQSGPIDESELTKFSLLVLRMSEALKRRFKFSNDFDEAQELAAKLDRFCKTYDVLAIINLVPADGGEFRGPQIAEHTERAGLELGPMNIYHKPDSDSDHYLFSLANLFNPGTFDPEHIDELATKGLTLFINMPCTRDPVAAFGVMLETAQQLCNGLNARLVDQKQHDLTASGTDNISDQIRKFTREMEAEGVTPGSDIARRLF